MPGRSDVIDRIHAAIARIKALYALVTGAWYVSLSKPDSSHGPADPSTRVSLPSTLHEDVLLIETREAATCSNPLEDWSYSGSVPNVIPSMSEVNNSEDQQVLSSQFIDPTGTATQGWLLEKDGVETIRSLCPPLNEEPQQPNPIHGPNYAQGLALYSTSALYGVELDFMSSGDYLQVHNHFANTRTKNMNDTVLDGVEPSPATRNLEQTTEVPQNPSTGNPILNHHLPNKFQHNQRGSSFTSERDQIVTLTARKYMQNIPDTADACHCWKELTYILGKLELKDHTLEPLEQSYVELVLSFQRKAVEKCTTMIACNCCPLSTERMMLLGLIVEKLVMAFKDLIRVCQENGLFGTLSYHHPNSCHDQPTSSLVRSQDSASISSSHFPNNTNTERCLFLGDYEVCSSEWAPLVNTLIGLYAKKLKSLLNYCKMWATAANQSATLAMLSNVEQQFEMISAIS
ncbi:hypothetical protein OAory_01026380 [Aspergillus oryzae]|uniref:Uncharacterized protein n=3 Tax=Aspergillus oryzae TaxID=5062 RepID=A0A1S9DYB0_ASPOZ|nr:hypothetical protein OAory_01026380 [Aspergillus oryzae]